MNIFLSYPSFHVVHAKRLRVCIEGCFRREGVEDGRVYFFNEHLRSGIWEESLRGALEVADVVVVFWSSRSKEAAGQLIEIGAAWCMRKRIVPVLFDVDVRGIPSWLERSQIVRWNDLEEKLCSFLLRTD